MPKRFVFSAGTGRCGTTSMCKLLNVQPNTNIRQETKPLPFPVDSNALSEYLFHLRKFDAPVVGDSAFYVTTYAARLIERLGDDVRIVYPYRECHGQVNSNEKFWHDRNQVTHPDYARKNGIDLGKLNRFYDAHPKFFLNKRDALWQRCELFHRIAHEVEAMYPDHFRIYYFKEILTDKQTQKEMLQFLGFENPVVQTKIWAKQKP